MTKNEIKKCENLMYEAIMCAKEAMQSYKDHNSLLSQNTTKAAIELRRADQKYGYAEGVNQTLATLGFKHDDMNTLGELL